MPDINDLTYNIIGAAIEVHRQMGPGLLESVYQECLAVEMAGRDIPFVREQPLPLIYRGKRLNAEYRVDFLCYGEIILELKAQSRIEAVHRAQLLSYLRLSNKHIGLLLNFHVEVMMNGVHRLINGRPPQEILGATP
jgi:GxxExxY protein